MKKFFLIVLEPLDLNNDPYFRLAVDSARIKQSVYDGLPINTPCDISVMEFDKKGETE